MESRPGLPVVDLDDAARARVGAGPAHDRDAIVTARVVDDAAEHDVTGREDERCRGLSAEPPVEVAALRGDEGALEAALDGSVRAADPTGEDEHVPGGLLALRRVVHELERRPALGNDEVERAARRPGLLGAARRDDGTGCAARRAADAEADGETRHVSPPLSGS